MLTEDDYFDDLIGTSAEKNTLSKVIEGAPVNASLLSLGFKLTDGTFRALFRLKMRLKGRELPKSCGHVAVQLDPEMQQMQDIDGAKGYPAEYFGQELNIDVYSGSAEPFLINLRDELARAVETTQTEVPPPPPAPPALRGLVRACLPRRGPRAGVGLARLGHQECSSGASRRGDGLGHCESPAEDRPAAGARAPSRASPWRRLRWR